MIDKLTPEQKSKLPLYRDKWLEIGLSTETIDRQKAKAAVCKMYQCAGLDAPEVFIFLDSPMQGAIAAAMMIDTRYNEVGSEVGSEVESEVWREVRNEVRSDVWNEVRSDVWNEVWREVRNEVRSDVWNEVRSEVRNEVGREVGREVRSDVWNEVWREVRNEVGREVGREVWKAVYGSHEASWLSIYDLYNAEFNLAEKAHGLIDVAKSCGWVWSFAGLVIITDRPETIAFDDNRRLHCENGPSIKYRDGMSIYMWHGTKIPSEWIDDPKSMTPKTVLTTSDTEVRAAGMEMLGWANMLDDLGAELVDSDPDPLIGDLYSVVLPDLDGRHLIVKYTCPRNGVMGQPVPPRNHINNEEITTVMGAKAFLADTTLAEYLPPEIRT